MDVAPTDDAPADDGELRDLGDLGGLGEIEEFSGLIRRVRRRAKLSQRELAAKLGVSQSTVARWETGRCAPSARLLAAAAGLAKLRLVVVDQHDEEVPAMSERAARDAGGRRYPAHVFVWAEGWWAPEAADMTGWQDQIQARSEELGMPQVRYSRSWRAWRSPTLADIREQPSMSELVAEAMKTWSRPPRRWVPIPEWAREDSRKSRNRRPVEFDALARTYRPLPFRPVPSRSAQQSSTGARRAS